MACSRAYFTVLHQRVTLWRWRRRCPKSRTCAAYPTRCHEGKTGNHPRLEGEFPALANAC